MTAKATTLSKNPNTCLLIARKFLALKKAGQGGADAIKLNTAAIGAKLSSLNKQLSESEIQVKTCQTEIDKIKKLGSSINEQQTKQLDMLTRKLKTQTTMAASIKRAIEQTTGVAAASSSGGAAAAAAASSSGAAASSSGAAAASSSGADAIELQWCTSAIATFKSGLPSMEKHLQAVVNNCDEVSSELVVLRQSTVSST